MHPQPQLLRHRPARHLAQRLEPPPRAPRRQHHHVEGRHEGRVARALGVQGAQRGDAEVVGAAEEDAQRVGRRRRRPALLLLLLLFATAW